MALKSHALDELKHYLPDNTFEDVFFLMSLYKIHLILKKDRKRILGDYRPAHENRPHTISLNISLNKYQFLITFIHEVAHLVNFTKHRQRVLPHGREWKSEFAILLKRFTDKGVFPNDIEKAILTSINNLAASTCSDPNLYRVLQRYDENSEEIVLVESIPIGSTFKTKDGRRFRVIEKRRTRYECHELPGNRKFLFPGLYEVLPE